MKIARRRRQVCSYEEHIIPPITHELGRSWDQPPTCDIYLETETGPAYMTEKTFKDLAEYSGTQPSGAYEGKMWRKNRQIRRSNPNTGNVWLEPTKDWFLCWYDVSEKGPEYCSTKAVKIEIVSSLAEVKAS